ncbi:unnamed protein product [Porites lobata]|uniref:Uncharacterized protein n=1 Tax=Porites lobata TaxID=104759 RepID=A0ABN8S0M5_9CNID|nr:unnamed protein product [Porites lobata]
MLFRNHLSLREYSNQGFEAQHTHYSVSYIQRLLPMTGMVMLHQANHSILRGCGWSRKKEVSWSKDDMAWIFTMNNLFNKLFCKDALSYEFDKGLKQVVILPDCLPIYQYDHALWEQLFPTVLTSFTSLLEQPQSPQSIPASSPAFSNTDPVSSSSTSLSSSPATSPSNSSCRPSSSVTVDTKTAFVP